jgi:adenylosuccinate synthase
MTSVVVVGTQWGDEGKGKITDFLSKKADIIARFAGGDNAGHTIKFDGETYKLHLIPSGIFYKDKTSVIGNGLVINPKSLVTELNGLQNRGVDTSNLRISNRAHVILPYHIHQDKVARMGIRIADLLDKDIFEQKLRDNLAIKNKLFEKLYEVEGIAFEDIFEEYYEYGQQLKQYVIDTSKILNDVLDEGGRVLFEGAQGVMLDVDQGTYPFVTSSNPVAGGVAIGAGVGPSKVSHVVGVCKAYTSRVGDGPFPSELFDEVGQTIREVGREYGTTTGRPRRVGWFDAVVVRHSRRVSGITHLALNSIDVLSGLETVKICTAYEYNGETITEYPANLHIIEQCKPVYEELPGWSEDITGVRSIDELPENARRYVERIVELTGIELMTFSVGPAREQTNVVKEIWV